MFLEIIEVIRKAKFNRNKYDMSRDQYVQLSIVNCQLTIDQL